MPATSAVLQGFLFLLQPLTVPMKQTRQAVCAIKQSILLRCLCLRVKQGHRYLRKVDCSTHISCEISTTWALVSGAKQSRQARNKLGSQDCLDCHVSLPAWSFHLPCFPSCLPATCACFSECVFCTRQTRQVVHAIKQSLF
jgi:hypothetical protein